MLTRTDSALNILDEAIKQDIFECQSLDESGNWIPVTDRSLLYAGLINELILEAQREGLSVMDDSGGNLFEERPIECVYCNQTECDQLDNGCTCESCTAQITDAIGM